MLHVNRTSTCGISTAVENMQETIPCEHARKNIIGDDHDHDFGCDYDAGRLRQYKDQTECTK